MGRFAPLKTGWKWISHFSTIQWVWTIVMPSTVLASFLSWVGLSDLSEPLWFRIAVFLVFIAISGILFTAIAVWRDNRAKKLARVKAAQLYLYENPDHQFDSVKGYIFVWTPTEKFRPVIADYGTYSASFPHTKGKEEDMTLHLFNPGPGDLRHLKIDWKLSGVKIPSLVIGSGVFDGFIESLTDNEIKMCAEHSWWSSPISTHQYKTIPLLREGETLPIKSPPAFTMALALCVLSAAKRQIKNKPLASAYPLSLSELSNEWNAAEPMRPIEIQVSYVSENGIRCLQKFYVSGIIRGNASVIKSTPNDEGVYKSDPEGVCGWIDQLRVTPL
jgi:hypothetical protein